MAEQQETKGAVYYIPDNFIGEERILNGQVRLRYLADSVLLTAVPLTLFGGPFWYFVRPELTALLPVLILIAGPGFVLGQLGCNGDPVSVFLANCVRWLRSRQVRLYNTAPRLLGTDPVRVLHDSSNSRDRIVGGVNGFFSRRRDRISSVEYVEGQNFAFVYDPGIDDYLGDSGDYDCEKRELKREDAVKVEIASEWDLSGLAAACDGRPHTDTREQKSADTEPSEAFGGGD